MTKKKLSRTELLMKKMAVLTHAKFATKQELVDARNTHGITFSKVQGKDHYQMSLEAGFSKVQGEDYYQATL